jgi:hypothetical protein
VYRAFTDPGQLAQVVENELLAGEMEAAGVPGADTRSGWESSFTKLDALL